MQITDEGIKRLSDKKRAKLVLKLALQANTLNAIMLAIITIYRLAIISGINNGLNQHIRTVAKRTGKLRRELRRGFLKQVPSFPGKKISIVFPFDHLSSAPVEKSTAYARFHVIGWQSLGKSYKRPSTPGTRPINPSICLLFVLRGIQVEMDKVFNKIGLDFRHFVKVKGSSPR